jgi:hypothetical protein
MLNVLVAELKFVHGPAGDGPHCPVKFGVPVGEGGNVIVNDVPVPLQMLLLPLSMAVGKGFTVMVTVSFILFLEQ